MTRAIIEGPAEAQISVDLFRYERGSQHDPCISVSVTLHHGGFALATQNAVDYTGDGLDVAQTMSFDARGGKSGELHLLARAFSFIAEQCSEAAQKEADKRITLRVEDAPKSKRTV